MQELNQELLLASSCPQQKLGNNRSILLRSKVLMMFFILSGNERKTAEG